MRGKMLFSRRTTVTAGSVVIALVAILIGATGCAIPSVPNPSTNAHGYRTWDGSYIKSFEHEGKRICIPREWIPVGATQSMLGWARFPQDKTGVFIEREYFTAETINPGASSYRLTVLFPHTLPDAERDALHSLIEQAFENVAVLFPEHRGFWKQSHTVLVTSHIEQGADGLITLYPDPHAGVSFLIYPSAHPRAEELFIHAVMHLHNRFRHSTLHAYQKNQSPIPPEDFQELEATWAETAYRSSAEGRENRLSYLYNVHRAVVENDFSRIQYPPFNNREAFERIIPSVKVASDATFLSAQYGHYVLGPLVMVAIDGLLYARGKNVDVETLLTSIHTTQEQNFFNLVAEHLSPEDINMVYSWMNGEMPIPPDMIMSALEFYQRWEE